MIDSRLDYGLLVTILSKRGKPSCVQRCGSRPLPRRKRSRLSSNGPTGQTLCLASREQRHILFSEAFQVELATLYQDSSLGQPPIPPAQLALATILQAYTGVSDDEVIEATTMDRRWQLVLDCLDCPEPPFSKGPLIAFRQRLIAHQLDRRLVERTIELATQTRSFGPRQLRAALDSSPLWGASRVEDTYNLLGHALREDGFPRPPFTWTGNASRCGVPTR
jgi:hypothetical protein